MQQCNICVNKYNNISSNKLYKLELKNFLIEWMLLGTIFIFIAIGLGFKFQYDYNDIIKEEKFKLTTHSRIVYDGFKSDIKVINNLLKSLRGDIISKDLSDEKQKLELLQYFEFINLILPNLSALELINKDGLVELSSRKRVLNLDYSDMEFFKTLKSNSYEKLFLSSPYLSPLGIWTTNLSLVIKDKSGQFNGALVAVIDTSKIIKNIQTALYSDSMNGTLIDFEGNVFLTVPEEHNFILGQNIDSSKYLFAKHKSSGSSKNCYIDRSPLYDKEIFVSFYDFSSEEIELHNGLTLAMSRDKEAVLKGFYMVVKVSIGLYLFTLIATIVGLYISQGRRNIAKQKEYMIQEHLKNSLESIANLDGLTNIPNRRSFDKTLDIEWRDSIRNRLPISLLFMDIDFFKNYNDTYGHQRGDECLRAIAKELKNSLNRARDFVARYGGEEFVCILPNTQKEGAINKAEELRAKIEALGLEHKSSKIADVVTISIGVCTVIPDETMHYEEIIKKADNALYLSKERGRNRVTFDS